MSDFNKWIGTGRLATEPRVYETKNGKSYARARVAITRGWGNNQDSMFVTAQFWGKTGEFVMQYGEVGRRIMMEAELNVLDRKDDDGNYQTSLFMNVNRVNFIDGKNNTEDRQEEATGTDALEQAYGKPAKVYTNKVAEANNSWDDGEEIPF